MIFQGGLHQCLSEKIDQGEPACGQRVPFSGLVQAHTPGKSRVFAAVGMEGTGETDWPAEEDGFELPVPPKAGAFLNKLLPPLQLAKPVETEVFDPGGTGGSNPSSSSGELPTN